MLTSPQFCLPVIAVMPEYQDADSSDYRQAGYPAGHGHAAERPDIDLQTLQEETADAVVDDVQEENIAVAQAGRQFAPHHHKPNESE